ncbi:MAG: hypothetical protein U0228_23155 [Myxococcaceae bacterium]
MNSATGVVCLLLNLWVLGAMLVFALISYPGFAAADPGAFPQLYSAWNARIGVLVVPFEFLAFLACFALYAFRSDAVPASWVHALIGLGVVYFAITFAWHLPAHRPLAAGQNGADVLRPLLTSQWVRTVVCLARVGLLGLLVTR